MVTLSKHEVFYQIISTLNQMQNSLKTQWDNIYLCLFLLLFTTSDVIHFFSHPKYLFVYLLLSFFSIHYALLGPKYIYFNQGFWMIYPHILLPSCA